MAVDTAGSDPARRARNSGKLFRNPLLQPLFDFLQLVPFADAWPVEQEIRERGTLPKTWLNNKASWRRMCHSQPPIRGCFIIHEVIFYEKDYDIDGRRKGPYHEMFMGKAVDKISSDILGFVGWGGSKGYGVKIEFENSFGAAAPLERNSQLDDLVRRLKEFKKKTLR
jgi:hypothetical protein